MVFLFKIGFLEVTWVDFIDIALVSILLYQVYKLIRGSIAVNIFLGILALYLIYLVVLAAQMELLSKILGQFMGVGVLAMIILFQPEIRKFLLVIGRSTEFREEYFQSGVKLGAINIMMTLIFNRSSKPQKHSKLQRQERS